jgi:ketosteroid isomerase-like protein
MSYHYDKAVQEVMQAEREWVEAHRRLDLSALDHLMGDDYTIIRPDGVVIGKQEALASYQSGQREWDMIDSDDYQVRVYGDTAIVIGRWTAKGLNNGQIFDYSARFTSIYVKRDGHWQMVADQSTPISRFG